MSTIESLLKYLREDCALSQSEIARRVGMGQPKLSRWIAGEVPESAQHIVKLQKLAADLKRQGGAKPRKAA